MLVLQPVEHPLPLLPGRHDPRQTQLRQMLRNRRRGLVHHLGQLVHRQLARLPQREDDPHPGRVREHPEHLHRKLDILRIRIEPAYLLICVHTQIIAHS